MPGSWYVMELRRARQARPDRIGVEGCREYLVTPCSPELHGHVDAALALHMLYHLPEPKRGVAELRRVVKPDGQALVVLNGENNMRELAELVAPIFGSAARDPSATVFALRHGADVLRRYFGKVELVAYPDNLEVTDPQDLIDYVVSMPGRDDAAAQTRLSRAVDDAFARDGGVFRIGKEVGLLRCTA